MMFSVFPKYLRSSPMRLYDLRVPRESAFSVINYLGELSLIQFLDSSPETPMYSRHYSKFLKRCEELQMKLDELKQIMQKFGKIARKPTDIPNFLNDFKGFMKSRNKPENSYFDDVETEIIETTEKLRNQVTIYEDFTIKCNGMHEKKVSLLHAKNLIGNNRILKDQEKSFESERSEYSEYSLFYWAGLVNKEDMPRFKRMVFRASKGNALIFSEDLKKEENPIDPKTLREKESSFYLMMFRGGGRETIKEKLSKIIESFGAFRFDFPTNPDDFQREFEEVEARESEFIETLNLTKEHIEEILGFFQEPRFSCSIFEEHRLFLLKEKEIYRILNFFKQDDGEILKIKCWCAESNEQIIIEALKSIAQANNHQKGEFMPLFENIKNPPTHFETNDFLNPFQEIVNTYGIPRYQEINPGLFTIISFPFLFGVMFGDIGHGFALLVFGIFLSFFGEKLKNVAQIRYLILLMGFFSIFCGFLYNEIFSIHLNLFGSCYQKSGNQVSRAEECVYSFGIDPIWGVSSNELAFYNSFKMKLAVILGVAQMTLGIFLKGFNTIYDCNFLDFFFEFLPQIIFMSATFIYLDVMIIIKWMINWDNSSIVPPSLIEQFLNLGLKMGGVEGDSLYNDQENIQRILFILAILSIPLMLLTKPLIIYTFRKTQEKEKKEGIDSFRRKSSGLQFMLPEDESKKSPNPEKEKDLEEIKSKEEPKELEEIKRESEEASLKEHPEHEHEEDKEEIPLIPKDQQLLTILTEIRDKESSNEDEKIEPMSEIIVHQIIETIEFVLGSISNTASYLRLWALSLAHSQLSKVFFEKTILDSVDEKNVFAIIIGYFLFINITFAVLMCMDVMECFLHALRLHWVEFQNKFYKADGYKFMPLSFYEVYKVDLEL